MPTSIDHILQMLTIISIIRFNMGPIIIVTSAILPLISFCIGCIAELNSKEWVPPVTEEEGEDPQPLEL